MPNIELRRKTDMSSFRMIALGTWKTAKDPSIYGSLELPMDEALAYIKAFREQHGRRLTVTHLVCRAIGAVLSEMPDANAILRFNRIYLRDTIKVFFQVVMEDPDTGQIDLSGLTIEAPHQKELLEIIEEFEVVAAKVRAGKDKDKEQTRQTFKRMPGWMVGFVLDMIAFLTYTLNLNLSSFGVPKDVFGSVMVTNIGSLGLKTAYVPLVPYSRVPLLVAMGEIEKRPVVDENDEIKIAQVMGLHATIDHRILDGAHAAHMSKTLKKWFSDPWTHFGGVDKPSE